MCPFRCCLVALMLFCLCAECIQSQSAEAGAATNQVVASAQTATYCDLLEHSERFKNQIVRVQAIYETDFEKSVITSSACPLPFPMMIWVNFSDGWESRTNRKVRKAVLNAKWRVPLNVVFIGKIKTDGRYGHMDMYPLLIEVYKVDAAATLKDTAQPSAWKTYKNTNYNFVVKYPPDWSTYEGLTKNGITIAPRNVKQFHFRPEMGASGSVGQPSEADGTRSENLEEDFQSRLRVIKEYVKGRNVVVLAKITTKIEGLPAIESTVRYQDSTGLIWFDKDVLVHSDDDSTTYHLGLHCSPDDVSVLVPLFEAICKSFRILGPRT